MNLVGCHTFVLHRASGCDGEASRSRREINDVCHTMVLANALPQVEGLDFALREGVALLLDVLRHSLSSNRASGCGTQDARFAVGIHAGQLIEAAHWNARVRSC